MTDAEFNARMDRLTERHEALTQSMEFFHRDMVDLKAETLGLKEVAQLLLEVTQSHPKRIERLEGQ
jgi:hypothetical protein